MKKIFLLSLLLIYSGVIFSGERTKSVSPSNDNTLTVSKIQHNDNTVKNKLNIYKSIADIKSKAHTKVRGENFLATTRYVRLTGSDVTGNGTYGNPWRTIKYAVANSNSGDNIDVGPGTFIETGQIEINKDLWIWGTGAGVTIVQKAENTGNPSSGNSRGWFYVTNAVTEFSLTEITLDGIGKDISIGILSYAASLYMYLCEIKNIAWQGGGSPNYYGRGVCIYAGQADIWNCTFENIGRIGVFTFGTGVLSNIVECAFTGKGAGDWLDYGFEVGGGAEIDVYASSISDCKGVASSDGSTSAGILATTYWGTGTVAASEWNTITNCETAVAVGYDASDVTYAVVRNNNLEGNDYAIWNSNSSNITYAPLNWYGSNSPAVVASLVSTGVDYSPWLNSDNDIDTGYPPFDPDLSVLWVDDNSPKFYPALGHIQEGIDLVSGSTVNVAAGTYVEQVHINKNNITINGAGKASTTIKSPATLTHYFTTGSNKNYPVVFLDAVSGTTVSNLTVDGDGKGNSNYRFQGIGFWNAGGTLQDVDVLRVMDTPFSGFQHGVAVYAYNNTGGPYTINCSNMLIDDYQKNGMALLGEGLTINLDNITTIGAGPTAVTAQNGIQVGYGTNGSISNCNVSGNIYTGGSWASTGILLYDGGTINITNTNISDNNPGVYVLDNAGSINGGSIINNNAASWDAIYVMKTVAKALSFVDKKPIVSPITENYSNNLSSKATLNFDLSNVTIQGHGKSNSSGVYYSSDANLLTGNMANCLVKDWDYGVITYENGGTVQLTANQNNIYGNTTFGFYSNTSISQNAKNNYWGHPSGPYDNKTLPNTPNYNNPTGLGDAVTAYVDYNPWTVNTPSTPYKLYLSNSPTVLDGIVYPNDSWPKPWEPGPDPGSGYPGDLGIDWGFLSGTTFYIVPEVGSFFGASTVTVEWDSTQYSLDSVSSFGGIYYGIGYFNTLLTSSGVMKQLTIDAGFFNNNRTIVSGDYIAKIHLKLLKTGFAPVNFYSYNFRFYDLLGGQGVVYFTDENAKVKSYLGDVVQSTPHDSSTGDGKVNFDDLSSWSASYWSGVPGYLPGLYYYKAKYDIGPTTTNTVYGMPVTDYKIQFEDLVIFSMSYGLSLNNVYPKIAPVPETPVEVAVGQAIASGNNTIVPIYISGAVQDLRAASLTLTGKFGKFISAEKGELLKSYSTPVMVMSRADGNTVYVDLSLVGADVKGLNQEGQLVLLTFEGKANVRLTTADLRNTANSTMLVKLGDNTRGIPTEFGLSQNYPNPFNPATVISYQVPAQAAVLIDVFNSIGEKVTTLVNEVKEPGYYEVTWNAASMTSGVYFFRINAGDFSAVKKMLLMK